MKNRFRQMAAIVLAAIVTFSLMSVPAAAASKTSESYNDIHKGDTCYVAAIYLLSESYMVGTGNGQFSPDLPVSRGMAATVLYRMAGKPQVTGAVSYTDFISGQYYSDALIWASENGILTGYPDNTIQADRSMSGAEANLILSRYAKNICGVDLEGTADASVVMLDRGAFAIAVHELYKQISLDALKKSFVLPVKTEGLSAEELLVKGRQYEEGDGVVQWYSMAMAYYEAAQDAGSNEAAEAIESLNAFKKKVMDNSPDAQGEVFTFFRTGVTAGQGGDYEKAYAVNYDDAFFFEDPLFRGIGELGGLLQDGKGVERDVEKAVMIYEFSAKVLGKGGAYSALSLLYTAETGTYPGIEHSLDKAIEYLKLSYQNDALETADFKGPRYLGDFYDSGYYHDDGSFEAPNYLKAEEAYLAASVGNGRSFDGTACYRLGVYYEEGREGIAQDYDKAAKYYLLAISSPNTHATMLGIPQTYLSLGRLYENGLGVEKDIEAAVSYYEKARDAAQENIDLVNAAGNEAAKAVLVEANEALKRLSKP